MQNEPKPDKFDILLRVGGFVAAAFLVWIVASANRLDNFTRSALAAFAAGLTANLFAVSKFEQRRFLDFGLGWPPRGFALGCLLGVLAVAAAVGSAAGLGLATLVPAPADRSTAAVAALLLAGAMGEEMLFRGYAFQYLIREWNPTLTTLGSGTLFGLLHLANDNVHPLGAFNTAIWGCLFGYAYVRTQSLWLPTGIHFGWNLALTLSTSNLSGTTIRAADWTLQWSTSDLWSGGSYGLEGGLLTTIVAVPVFLLVRRVR